MAAGPHHRQVAEGITTTNNSQAIIISGNAQINGLRSASAETLEQKCRNALFLTDPHIDRASLISTKSERVDGTCEWIRQDANYNAWLNDDGIGNGNGNCDPQRLLWILGGPGKGKTMLSVFLTQELEKHTDRGNAKLVYFFCSHQDERRNTGVAVLRGLVHEIITQRPQLIRHALPYFETPSKTQHTLHSPEALEYLWRIFSKLVSDAELGTMFCVLDGLDECEEGTLRVLALKFISLLAGSASTPTNGVFKLAIVSRDIPGLPGLQGCTRVRLDPDNDEKVVGDIELFVTARVRELSRSVGFGPEFCAFVQTELLKRAERTFLWAGFAMYELSQKQTCTEIEAALKKLPSGLPAIYSRMLLRIPARHREMSRAILRWVTMAVRPLQLRELCEAVNVQTSDHITQERAIRDAVDLCGPLLKVSKQVGLEQEVSLVHQSARDYLLRKERDSHAVLEEFRLDSQSAHLELARRCLDCVAKSGLQQSVIDLSAEIDSRESPLLRYAALHWPEHVKSCPTQADQLFDPAGFLLQNESSLRIHWWKTYDRAMTRKRRGAPPLLHMACSMEVIPWVGAILASKNLLPGHAKVVDSKDDTGRTALHWAAQEGKIFIVQLLVLNGADLKARNKHGETALHLAVKRENEAVAQFLIDKRANVKAKDDSGQTVLHSAARGGNKSVVQLLLRRGADPEAKNKDGETALQSAEKKGNNEVVWLLRDKQSNQQTDRVSWNALQLGRALFGIFVPKATDEGVHVQPKDGDRKMLQHQTDLYGSIAAGDRQLTCDEYYVAWICPVADLELLPSYLMLDEVHVSPQFKHHDENNYICGSINGHTVVIGTCPQGMKGSVNAGRLMESMYKTFPNIRLALLVGIGSGMPNPKVDTDPLRNIHLGDVVVGWSDDDAAACIYYDWGRRTAGGDFVPIATMQAPDWRLMNALANFKSDQDLGRITTLDYQLARLQRYKKELKTFAYPGLEYDKLFIATYRHIGGCYSGCTECDHNELVRRPERAGEEQQTFVVHFGRIATGNAIVQDGELRDRIRSRCNGAICVEMEAAGVEVNRRCLVVRGISDYADSHKSDLWKSYAAGKAAAFARELLCKVKPDSVKAMDTQSFKAPWLVSLPRPRSFVGRGKQLKQVDTCLSSGSHYRFAIYGLGGCGKSAFALEVAYRTRQLRPTRAIYWIPSSTREDFEQAYRDMGILLRIPGIKDPSADVTSLVKAKLSDEHSGQWLMIIDNADEFDVLFAPLDGGQRAGRLIDCIPESANGSVIFTTRNMNVAMHLGHDNIIELGAMAETEALELLETQLHPEHHYQLKAQTITDNFLSLLAFHALAIVQAVAFINRNGISLAEYISLYRANEQAATQLLLEQFEDAGRHNSSNNTVAGTWVISFEQIRKHDTLAAEYLSFMACTANNNIPASMLPASASSIAQTTAIGTLKAYAFINQQTLQEDTLAEQDVQQARVDMFDIHPLVHLATRGWLKEQSQWDIWTEKTIARMRELIPYGDYTTRKIWTPYLQHAMQVCSSLTVNSSDNKVDLVDRIGRCQLTLGQYRAVENTYRVLLEWEERKLGPKHVNTLASLHLIGEALREQGKYMEAEQMHRRTLELREQVLGKEHPDTLTSLSCMGLALKAQGKYLEAEQVQRMELSLREKLSSKEHPDTLTSMNNLAIVLEEQGKVKEAEQMHRRTLLLKEKVLGKEHPDTLMSMSNLAVALNGQGNHAEADAIYRGTLSTREKVLGKEHPETLRSMNQVAMVLTRQKKFREAEELYRETLALREMVLGPEHPDTLTSVQGIGFVLQQQGDYKDALLFYEQAYKGFTKTLGSDHPASQECAYWYDFVQDMAKGRLSDASDVSFSEDTEGDPDDTFDPDQHGMSPHPNDDSRAKEEEDGLRPSSGEHLPSERLFRSLETTMHPGHSDSQIRTKESALGHEGHRSKYPIFVGWRTRDSATLKEQPLIGNSEITAVGEMVPVQNQTWRM